ncbi:hypothetical protein Sste5346_000808 [Sporothrix stenoceras]|uniref:Uncharacterized protein n=1 Tax=Sporothrix stenoceras TaxID=5173 RepID=A0ABR3ZRY2_9PEZI
MEEDVPMDGAQPAASVAPGNSTPAASAPLNGTGKTSAAWNTPKHREEADNYRQRLTDQGFNASEYGDPLTAVRPLDKIYSRPFPEGTEESLRALIEKK